MSSQDSTKRAVDCPLLTWDNPRKTGKVFFGIVISLILINTVNLVSLFFRIGAYSLVCVVIAEYIGKLFTGAGFASRFRPTCNDFVSTKIASIAKIVIAELPSLEKEVQDLLFAVNIQNTAKAAGLFYLFFIIASIIPLYQLLLSSTIILFTAPLTYDRYHEEIDALVLQYLKLASKKGCELVQLAKEKSAPFIAQADEKLGPVSKFVKQKFQPRTASSTVRSATPQSEILPELEVKSIAQSKSSAEFPDVPETAPLLSENASTIEFVEDEILRSKQAIASTL